MNRAETLIEHLSRTDREWRIYNNDAALLVAALRLAEANDALDLAMDATDDVTAELDQFGSALSAYRAEMDRT